MKLFSRPFLRGLIVLTSFASQPAVACMTDEPLVIEDIRQADAVFVGSVVRYEIVSLGQPDGLDDYGLITVRVKDVIRGSLPEEVQLYWWNSTFGMPDTLLSTDPALFAAVRSDSNSLPLRGASATIYPNRREDLLQVMQAPCSEAFILPYDQTTATKIHAILKGGLPKGYDPNEFDKTVPVREVPAIHRKKKPIVTVILAIATALGAIAALWAVRRKRRGKSATS